MRSASRVRLRATVIALVAGLTVCIAGVGAGTASATNYPYACLGLSPNSWCYIPQHYTFGYNSGSAVPAQVINICAKLTVPGTTDDYYARKCELTSLVQIYSNGGGRAPYPNNTVPMRAWLANGNNTYAHDFAGLAQY